jgi:hypothetical protein
MHVEDSYEGAVRRLERLRDAGFDLAPPMAGQDPQEEDRMRDLEQLATLACEENERLQQELAETRESRERLQRELDEALGDDSLERELAEARDQVGSLQRLVAMLEETAARPRPTPLAHPDLAADVQRFERELSAAHDQIVRLQQHVALLEHNEYETPLTPAKTRSPIWYALMGAAAGGLLCAALLGSPAPRPQLAPAPAALPPAPVVTAPPPLPPASAPAATERAAPATAAPAAKPAAPAKAAAPTVSAKSKTPAKRHPEHNRRSERPSHRASQKVAEKGQWTHTSDPLGGLNL